MVDAGLPKALHAKAVSEMLGQDICDFQFARNRMCDVCTCNALGKDL